ncbi:MAG: ribosome silencing factor [Tissierellia bacterium]|nr:ribosome silencing factor [Tissierellia bacterium]
MEKLNIIKDILDQRQAEDIKVIDLSDRSSVADYFVIATGNSINHNKALADRIEEELEKNGYKIGNIEGLREGNWILIDAFDIIVHIFTKKDREYYDLDELWEE